MSLVIETSMFSNFLIITWITPTFITEDKSNEIKGVQTTTIPIVVYVLHCKAIWAAVHIMYYTHKLIEKFLIKFMTTPLHWTTYWSINVHISHLHIIWEGITPSALIRIDQCPGIISFSVQIAISQLWRTKLKLLPYTGLQMGELFYNP